MRPFVRIGRAAAVIAALLGARIVAADERFDGGQVVKAVVQTVELSELRQIKIDDRVSRLWFAEFFARLDPRKMYFLVTDLDEFRKDEARLDDLARAGNFEFAELVRARYAQRVREAARHAEAYADGFHDYTLDEEIPKKFDRYAGTVDELRDRWRKRIKLALLTERVSHNHEQAVRDQLIVRYRRLARDASAMDDEQLGRHYLGALMASIDPNAGYMSPSEVESFNS